MSKGISKATSYSHKKKMIQKIKTKATIRPSSKKTMDHQQKAAPKPQLAPRKKKSGFGLSASQLKDLEKKLFSLRSDIASALSEKATTFNSGPAAESLIKGDDAEVAEKQRMNNAALQELDFLKSRLILVDRALRKMEEGVFGICEESEEPIGFERLSVVPWARYSVHVQEVRERKLREYKVNRLRSEL